MWTVVVLFSLVVLHVLIYMFLNYHKHQFHFNSTFYKVSFHSQSKASKHLSTQTFILNKVCKV
jgi:hypothetical protein